MFGWFKNKNTINSEELLEFDDRGFRLNGIHRNGTFYDEWGYDKNGYDRDGYNKKRFNMKGIHKNGSKYDYEGYDKEGYDEDGYNEDGYNKDGIHINGYDKDGYDEYGFDRYGIHKNGSRYDDEGYNKYGYDKDGYDFLGYNILGYHKEGYDEEGYDKYGFNIYEYDRSGMKRDSRDKDGYDKYGFDYQEYDRDGFNRCGFNHQKIHRNGTIYDDDGYNYKGYNKYGLTSFDMKSNLNIDKKRLRFLFYKIIYTYSKKINFDLNRGEYNYKYIHSKEFKNIILHLEKAQKQIEVLKDVDAASNHIRQACEGFVEFIIYRVNGIKKNQNEKLFDLISRIENEYILGKNEINFLHKVREIGNQGSHYGNKTATIEDIDNLLYRFKELVYQWINNN